MVLGAGGANFTDTLAACACNRVYDEVLKEKEKEIRTRKLVCARVKRVSEAHERGAQRVKD